MRLLAQNLLVCNKKTCAGRGVPLRLQVMELRHEPTDFNAGAVRALIGKLNWPHFCLTVGELGVGLPQQMGETELASEEVLQLVQQYLLDTHIQAGSLQCVECGRIYPIENGIANFLLDDSELV